MAEARTAYIRKIWPSQKRLRCQDIDLMVREESRKIIRKKDQAMKKWKSMGTSNSLTFSRRD